MTKKEIQLRRQLERQKYVLEYHSDPEFYEIKTAALISLQIAFKELIEVQMKVNPNRLLKALDFALNNWINEPSISLDGLDTKESAIDQYTVLSNLGFEMVEQLESKLIAK
jgi:hypothetical protein